MGGDDHGEAHEQLDVIRAAAGGHCRAADSLDLGASGGLVLPGDEHALGMAPGEGQAAIRGAGLEQHRGALPRGLAEVIALDVEEFAVVRDLAYLLGAGIDPLDAIADHRIVGPAAFEQLVEHFQVFVAWS